ncbi:MAG: hypothetical protein WC455_17335 [Dehalococcoidia bacterium]|jgi:predicted DNA binding CopG/RHH family protein
MGVNWGAVAGGVNQGLHQGVRTIADIVNIQHAKAAEERQQNLYNYQMKKLADEDAPVFLDTFRQNNPNVGDNVFNALKARGEAAGLVYKSADGREFVKRGQAKEFMKFLGADDKEELIGAQLKDLSAAHDALSVEYANVKDKAGDEAQKLKAKLDELTKQHDALSYQSTAYLQKKALDIKAKEAERKAIPTIGQIKGQLATNALAGQDIGDVGNKLLGMTGDANQTEQQLTARALKGDKEAQAILDAMQTRKLNIAKENRAIIGNPAGKNSFPNWEQADKEMAFQGKMLTGKDPMFASRDAESRAAFSQGYNQYIRSKGFRASDIALMQADYRAGNMSLGNMSKQEAPMNAFVLNINKQIGKLEELYKNDDRIGLRLLDLPLRELKLRAKGSGLEASRASYLLEISNEIGKLSSGASASVQQLSDSAKEDWKKVHDPNLSLKELMIVLNSTRDQANMRMSTWREAKEAVRANIRGLGTDNGAAAPASGETPVPAGHKGFTFKDGKLVPNQ